MSVHRSVSVTVYRCATVKCVVPDHPTLTTEGVWSFLNDPGFLILQQDPVVGGQFGSREASRLLKEQNRVSHYNTIHTQNKPHQYHKTSHSNITKQATSISQYKLHQYHNTSQTNITIQAKLIYHKTSHTNVTKQATANKLLQDLINCNQSIMVY